VAPAFAARYPEAAIIFDNLHSMHDVISDILANPSVPRDRKRAEILHAARRYRDDTSYVMSVDAWRTMSDHMGVENMGGLAVGFLPDLPRPTVTYGAVMRHDDRTGEMIDFIYGSGVDGAHAGHGAPGAPGEHAGHGAPAREPRGHEGHGAPPRAPEGHERHDAVPREAPSGAVSSIGTDPVSARALEFIVRLLTDPTVEARIHADPHLHRLWADPLVQQQLRILRREGDGEPHTHHDPEGS
jgi:hypothetical protein